MRDGTLQASVPVKPGVMTQLLAELARAPEATGWQMPVAPGEIVGRFQILREIGRGGFGVVYEARDTELARSVAFKALREIGVEEPKAGQLLAEAEAAARLAHPNIVHLYDLGRCERGPYLILELLHGRTLSEQLKEGPLPSREALRVCVEMAKGLAHAHGQGVVHRDVKPGNVFLCQDGQVKLLDFGMAHVFGRAGLKGGTPAYMAPEQAAGQAGDERADVYALGVTLYQVLTGKLPFEEGERGVPSGGAPPEIPGAPTVLERLVGRMLAREPGERPKDGAEAHELLRAFQRTLEPRKQAWLAWSVAALALVAGGAFALRQRPLPPGRLLTAMADTENLTGDPDLDGVGELLRVGLEQSKRVSIMARSRLVNLLEAAGSPIPKVIGEAEARSAAQKAKAQVLFVPAVRLQEGPGGYDVVVRAVDLGRDEPLFAVRESAGGKGSVPGAIDRLTARIRKALHEDPKEAPKTPVSAVEVAPASPEAWRLYAEGQRLFSDGRFEEATKAYQRAIAISPDFLLPRVAFFDGPRSLDWPAQNEHLRTLGKNIHRLPPRERAYVEALILDHRAVSHTDRLALLDRAIEAWPEDPRPYVSAANENLWIRGDVDAARPYMEKHVALAPPHDWWVIDYLMALGRLDDALGRTLRWTEESPTWVSFLNLSYVRRFRGETSQALDAARRATALYPDSIGDHFMTFADAGALEELESLMAKGGRPAERRPYWLALRGRLREALAAFDAQAPPATAPDADHREFHARRSYVMIWRGDPAAVYREVEEAFRLGYDTWHCSAWPLALLGDAERARRIAAAQYVHDHNVCWRMYRAVRTWKRGDREAALPAFAGIYHPASHLYRGEILSELGRDREAVEAFRLHRRAPGPGPFLTWALSPVNLPRSLYLEAVALERLGEKDEARNVAGRLLHLWEPADPDLPLLREARALGRRLGVMRREAGGGGRR